MSPLAAPNPGEDLVFGIRSMRVQIIGEIVPDKVAIATPVDADVAFRLFGQRLVESQDLPESVVERHVGHGKGPLSRVPVVAEKGPESLRRNFVDFDER